MAEYDGPGAYERAYPDPAPGQHDAREEMRDAIRRGLREAGHHGDPDQFEDYEDAIVRALMEVDCNQIGWFILGDLEHVYRVEHARMTDAEPVHHSGWYVQTRNDL